MNTARKISPAKPADSRQQLVEILGLSGFLRSRIEYLEANTRIGRGSLSASKEITLIRQALSFASESEVANMRFGLKLHSSEAGHRLGILFKRSSQVTHADIAHARGMSEFADRPDVALGARGAYLRALNLLGLASDAELAELKQIEPQAAANS